MLKKLPKAGEILPVFAVITAMTYGWTLAAFLWKLPSWLHYLTPGEILAIYSYSVLTDFNESAIFLALLLCLCLALPARMLREVFVLRGTILALCVLGGMMFLLGFYINNEAGLIGIFPAWTVILASAIIMVALLDVLSRKFPPVASTLTGLAERLTIFLYINLPLSILALVVVTIRNLQ
jgi:hypothetical protein